MLASSRRFVNRHNIVAILALLLFVGGMWSYFLQPAMDARTELQQLLKDETPDYCDGKTDRQVQPAPASGPDAGREQQAEGDREATHGKSQEGDVTNCLDRAQIAVASRANMIAIFSARSSTAAVFVSIVAAIAAIFATAVAAFALRRTSVGVQDAALVLDFVAAGAGDRGDLSLTNVGTAPIHVDVIALNDQVLRSCATDGLVRIDPTNALRLPVELRSGPSGARLRVKFRPVSGGWRESSAIFDRRGATGWVLVASEDQ